MDTQATDFIKAVYQTAVFFNFPIAIWRLPNQQEVSIAISTTNVLEEEKISTLESKKGFCFQRFINQGNKAFFIAADIFYDDTKIIFADHISKVKQTKFLEKITHFLTKKSFVTDFYCLEKQNNHETSAENYIHNIGQAVESIKEGAFLKTVISKVKHQNIPKNFSLIDYFFKIQKNYLHAFVSILSTPTFGTWIGASPEILISINQNKIFKTIALAGTQVSTQENLSEAIWRQKEIEEQALVSRYIVNCFKKIRLREFDEYGPRTVKAANLLHLKTEFTVNIDQVKIPNLGSIMLDLLHPTSAICGMPKEESMAFILANEKHDRKLFCGFLGPINIHNETHVFVNLRCAELSKNQLSFYAGAGITEDSNPEKEWIETDMKCNTLLSLL